MRKIYYIWMLLAAMCFGGCEKKADIDHPIAGHTYVSFMGTEPGDINAHAHFHAKGDFTITYFSYKYTGNEMNTYGNMLWSVEGNNITIKNDNSSILSSVRGKIQYTGLYNPNDSTVTLNNVVYEFLE